MSGQQQPIRESGRATMPSVTRSSPFASSPVTIVNQTRPGFGAPGQFPGHVVRAAPTQLATPLVPQRHLSATIASNSSQIPDPLSLFGGKHTSQLDGISDLLRRPAQPGDQSAASICGQASLPSFQRHRSTPDPFGSPSASFQMEQAHSEVLEERKDPFGVNFGPQQPSQQDNYKSRFCSPEKLSAPSIPTLSRHSSLTPSQSPIRSTLSNSPSPPSQSQASQLWAANQHQSLARSSGQAPPPAAPFLGYTDNTRSQSVRASGPTSGSIYSDAQKMPLSVHTAALAPPSTSHHITLKAPSANELVNEFMKIPVNERFAGFESAVPLANMLHMKDISDSLPGLEALYAQKRWKSLTKKSLSMLQKPSNDPNLTLEIKSWWLAGLIKEGHYDNAASVLDQIGNLDELSFSDGESLFVHVRLYLLQALLSKCQGKFVYHEKQLFHLILRLKSAFQQNETKTPPNVKMNVAARWLRIAQFALANHLVYQQKFMLALKICSQIDEYYVDGQEKVIVLSRVGRIRLQMGDLEAAGKLFNAARLYNGRLIMESGDSATLAAEVLAALEARLLLNDGLLLFAQNKLQEALSAFDSILQMHNALPMKIDDADADLYLEEDVVCSAVNNYAICALYCCDVKAAVAALERMIRSNPRRFLNGVVVFNLSSLYDLLFDNATSKSRKEMMKKIAKIYDLEHVDPATYRI